MSGVVVTTAAAAAATTTASGSSVRAREILDSLKQQREEISQLALHTFAYSSSPPPNNAKTIWRSSSTTSTAPTTPLEIHVPVMTPSTTRRTTPPSTPDTREPSSSSRSHVLQEVVKERRENLLDMLKAASSCRTINSQHGSMRSSATGRTDELSSLSPEDNNSHTNLSNNSESISDRWEASTGESPSLEPKGTASLTDDSSSEDESQKHHIILLPELTYNHYSAPWRWSKEEICVPPELRWTSTTITSTTMALYPCNGPRPQSKISLKGRYVSPTQMIAKRLGLGQHRLRKGSMVRAPKQGSKSGQKSSSSSSHNKQQKKPPVVVVFHHEIVDDHQKRNMMLRSMMLDVIFLRRQYAHFDAKRAAAIKAANLNHHHTTTASSSSSKYGLWGPYAKCFLSDDVSLPFTSDSDTSGWFTDDESTAAGTYGVEYSVAKKWLNHSNHSSSGITNKKKSKDGNKGAFTPPQAVTTRPRRATPTSCEASAETTTMQATTNDQDVTMSNALIAVVEDEEEEEDDWMMPEELSDQLCGAYGGMYFLYKKQRRVRLSTIVEI
jgi:hypothetical protein